MPSDGIGVGLVTVEKKGRREGTYLLSSFHRFRELFHREQDITLSQIRLDFKIGEREFNFISHHNDVNETLTKLAIDLDSLLSILQRLRKSNQLCISRRSIIVPPSVGGITFDGFCVGFY
jgi:hypothetical protein